MSRFKFQLRACLAVSALIAALLLLLALPMHLTPAIGTIDFRPYWSSAYLLVHGLDYSDASALERVERTLTGWQGPYMMHAWFAPTGNLVLIPLTLLPFHRAAYYWLLANISIVSISALLIWRTTHAWLSLVAAFAFSMTLLSILFGQVNTLVLLGLALFLLLTNSQRDYAAGASLVLTTIKPHLVVITLPLLFADILRRRQWRVLAGFAAALAVAGFALSVLNDAWPASFWRLISSGMSLARETPSISGLLVIAGVQIWPKLLWAVVLGIALTIWWRFGTNWDRRSLVDVSILVGLAVAPVGWSYDQIMLLFPILRLLQWAVDGSLQSTDSAAVVVALLAINAITFYERVSTPSEVWFFWVPMAVGAVYAFAWYRRRGRPAPAALSGWPIWR